MIDFPNVDRKCQIKGQQLHYDACATNSLKEAKIFYSNFDYIGSSYVYFINGVKNKSDKRHHFFTRKPNLPSGEAIALPSGEANK